MLAKVYSCAVVGLEGRPVEVDISQGLPSFLIVGLPDTAVQESKERVRAAVKNSGATFPIPKPRQCANHYLSLCAAEKEAESWQRITPYVVKASGKYETNER
jgi:predicted ATPase with chaperone activity